MTVTRPTATGTVEVVQGAHGARDGHGRRHGRATLALPARALPPGTHDLTLRYVGDANHKATSSSVQVIVEKVVPTDGSRSLERRASASRPS